MTDSTTFFSLSTLCHDLVALKGLSYFGALSCCPLLSLVPGLTSDAHCGLASLRLCQSLQLAWSHQASVQNVPPSPAAFPHPKVQCIGEKQQHPALDTGTAREEGRREGGHSPNLRLGTWVHNCTNWQMEGIPLLFPVPAGAKLGWWELISFFLSFTQSQGKGCWV